jgi:hypothetical protein
VYSESTVGKKRVRRTCIPGFFSVMVKRRSPVFLLLREYSLENSTARRTSAEGRSYYTPTLFALASSKTKKGLTYYPPAAWLRLWSHVAVTEGVMLIELPEASISPVLVLYWETPCWLVTLPVLVTC